MDSSHASAHDSRVRQLSVAALTFGGWRDSRRPDYLEANRAGRVRRHLVRQRANQDLRCRGPLGQTSPGSQGMSADAIADAVGTYARPPGWDLATHDLRRTRRCLLQSRRARINLCATNVESVGGQVGDSRGGVRRGSGKKSTARIVRPPQRHPSTPPKSYACEMSGSSHSRMPSPRKL